MVPGTLTINSRRNERFSLRGAKWLGCSDSGSERMAFGLPDWLQSHTLMVMALGYEN